MELRQRIRDHARRLHVIDRDGVAVVGVRVEPGVVARRDCDLGELLDRRAVLRHVPARRHGVPTDERDAPRRVELAGTARRHHEVGCAVAPLEVRTRRGTVREHHHVDEAGTDRSGRVLQHELPDRSADHRAFDPRRTDAQVLTDLHRRQLPETTRHEAADVVLGQAGISERACRPLVDELERGLVVDPADVGQCSPDDRDSSLQWSPYFPVRGRMGPARTLACTSRMLRHTTESNTVA